MIKFFRKIRQQLLTENKFSKYLIYAIGEIILVVIGILIALSINNWNEWKKERVKEREILIGLVANLEINIKTVESDIENFHLLDKSSETVLSTINNKQPYTDTLAHHFHIARIPKQELFLAQTGYEEYKDAGLHILTNKNLKNEVLNLFETVFPKFFSNYKMVNEFNSDFDNHVVQNFIYKNHNLEPINYQDLLTDHYYISWIRAYKEGRITLIQMEEELLRETKRVLRIIRDELK